MTFRVILLSLSFCLISINAFGRQDIFPFVAEVTKSRVNVRAGQSANFERLCQLNKGDIVVVHDQDFSWYKISIPNIARSFVSEDFVQLIDETQGQIIGKRVNVRGGPGSGYTILGQLNVGDLVNVIEVEDNWVQIEPVENTYAWISDQFLVFISKDIEAYQPKKIVKKVKPPVAEVEEVPVPEVKEVATPVERLIAVEGIIKSVRSNEDKLSQYMIETSDQKSYQLRGVDHVLDRFLNYKVSLEGTLMTRGDPDGDAEIMISKLQLIL